MPIGRWFSCLLLSSWIVACSTPPERRPPSIAHGHIGQLLVASSSTRNARPLLASAQTSVERLIADNDALHRAVRRRNAARARQIVLDMVARIAPTGDDAGPPEIGLRQRLDACVMHTSLARDAAAADELLQARLDAIAARAAELVERVNDLETRLRMGSQAASLDTLSVVSAEADQLLAALLGGGDRYGLRELERDLQLAVESETRTFSRIDSRYFRAFSFSTATSTWEYRDTQNTATGP